MKRISIVLIIIISLFQGLTGCKKDEPVVLIEEEETKDNVEEEIVEKEDSLLYVYVCGSVVKPGVYKVKGGSRYFEAVELAGGMTEDASAGAINLALIIEDGAQIYIPSVSEDGGVEASSPEDGLISINKGTQEDLLTLPGIGESKARDIIAYREDNGGFKELTDLMMVPGIKEGTFNKIKDKIKL